MRPLMMPPLLMSATSHAEESIESHGAFITRGRGGGGGRC